jgi:hypothetical protein
MKKGPKDLVPPVDPATRTIPCSYCKTERPASEIHKDSYGKGWWRCQDTRACTRRKRKAS